MLTHYLKLIVEILSRRDCRSLDLFISRRSNSRNLYDAIFNCVSLTNEARARRDRQTFLDARNAN